MRIFKFLVAFVLALMIVSPASAMTGNSGQPVHYVALGDSLAVGFNENSELGKGYTDFLAEMLEEKGKLASYNKGFAYPGYKTTNILADIEANVKKPINFTGEEVRIVDDIKKADVITLSVGANDVLAAVGRNEDGTLTFDLPTVSATIQKTASNVDQILKKLAAINPTADVFVMGYYNPFPYKTSYMFYLNLLVNQMDSAIKKVVTDNSMYFVPVSEAVDANPDEYVPNPDNIHPSEAGYKVIAEQFIGPVMDYVDLVPEPGVEPEPGIVYPKFKDVKANTATAEFVGKAAYYGIVKGYSDGTFKPNKKLTRAQVTSMLVRTLGLTKTKKVPYTDTSKLNAETQKEIAKAYAAGLIENKKKFKPNEAVSRIEVAKMISDAYSYVMGRPYLPDDIAPFKDISKLTLEQKQYVTLLYDFEIATGDNGKFKPNSAITRAQAAKMLVNVKEKLD